MGKIIRVSDRGKRWVSGEAWVRVGRGGGVKGGRSKVGLIWKGEGKGVGRMGRRVARKVTVG